MNSKRLLVIPSYNCAAQIQRLIQRLARLDLNDFSEIIFIDNDSGDGTAQAIEEKLSQLVHPCAVLLKNEKNIGLGGTFKKALNIAMAKNYDWLFFLHGDDQARPDDMPRFIALTTAPAADLAVLGSRFMAGSTLHTYSKIRTFGNRIINKIFSAVVGRPILDIGSGLNAYGVRALEKSEALSCGSHIVFAAQIMLGLCNLDGSIRFLPIQWHEEDQVSNAKNIPVALKALLLLMRWKLSQRKLSAIVEMTSQYRV